jgi:hypothetical protein
MEIDPSKSLNQLTSAGQRQQTGGGDASAFRAALDKARAGTEGAAPSAAGAAGGAASARSPAELAGMLRHQAVQEEGRVQQALDLVTSLSADFAHGQAPRAAELQSADATLARLEQQAGADERGWLRDARTAVNFYLGRLEREEG